MKMNPKQRKKNKTEEREWRTESSQLMTGLLCISALTNEHSNKGEPKDQCVRAGCVAERM